MHDRHGAARAAITAIVLLAVLCAALVVHLLARQEATLRPERVSKLAAIGRSVADQVGLTLEYGIPFESIRGMDEFLAAMAAPNPEIAYVAVTGADGRVLYRRGGAPASFSPPHSRQVESVADDILDVAVPLPTTGGVRGGVHVGMAQDLSAAGRVMTLAALTLAAAAGLAAIAILGFGRRRIARPLGRITAALADPGAAVPGGVASGRERGEILSLAVEVQRLRGGLAARRAEILLDLEEIALAQPEVENRRAVRAIAAEIAP